jgi:hypothetical protein
VRMLGGRLQSHEIDNIHHPYCQIW